MKNHQLFTKFASLISYSSIQAHIFHLQTPEPIHSILGDFYEEASDHFDTIVENYQGTERIRLKGYDKQEFVDYSNLTSLIYFFESILDSVKEFVSNLELDSDTLNLIDSYKELIKKTVFKLDTLNNVTN